MPVLDLNELHEAVNGSAAAFRCRRKLQPAGGAGDKVFPPTFAGAVYATEQRRVPGRTEPVNCVILDTVQSQANRMEAALQEAIDAGLLRIPLIRVDFTPWSPQGFKPENERLIDDVGIITSLQVPHRIADAILRDSQTEEGIAFRQTEMGRGLNSASQRNATPLYLLCPTALIFGMWDSTGPKGGLGAKFERALVSEVVGINTSFGIKTASRIDPLITKTEGIEVYKGKDRAWTLTKELAEEGTDGKPVLLGKGDKKGKVSNANLGNVLPASSTYSDGATGIDVLKAQQISNPQFKTNTEGAEIIRQLEARKGQIAAGGVSIDYAEQLTTLSMVVLRRLILPVPKIDGESEGDYEKRRSEAQKAGRTVLAALGLCAATLAFESGQALRSRCLLWPEESLVWDILEVPGKAPAQRTLNGPESIILLKEAVEAAKSLSFAWNESSFDLRPGDELLKLVRRSQELACGVIEE